MIVGVAEQLAQELGERAAEAVPGSRARADHVQLQPWGSSDLENAQLVARLSRALAQVASAAAGQAERDGDEKVAAALVRTELVTRGELMRGDEAALRDQLPGFVFLVVLPGAGMDRALALANRARDLLEEALR